MPAMMVGERRTGRGRKAFQDPIGVATEARDKYDQWGVRCAGLREFTSWYAAAVEASQLGQNGYPNQQMWCDDADATYCNGEREEGRCPYACQPRRVRAPLRFNVGGTVYQQRRFC